MSYKKNRIIITILGFFVLTIPLLFIYTNINREISFTQERIEEDLREKILNTANEIERKLNPDNYLKSEFNIIHKKLFSQYPEMILDKLPDDTFSKTLYTKETLNQLLSLIKERFHPIIVTLGNENFENIYAYYSKELEKDIDKEKPQNSTLEEEKNKLLISKSYFDIKRLTKEYKYYFNAKLEFNKLNELSDISEKGKFEFDEYCYKYISRFSRYEDFNSSFYSDYFKKQKLFPIMGYTYSPKGIHGFYSCLIPQSYLNPKLILDSVIKHHDSSTIIYLDDLDSLKNNIIYKTNNGFEYRLKYPTIFISQINALKRLKNLDFSKILNKQIKIQLNYPPTYKKLNLLKKINIFTTSLIFLLYLLLSIRAILHSNKFKIKLSIKLILILAIILFLPIIGIGMLSLVISNNLDELIDKNVSESLHNKLENFYLLEKEKNVRHLSSIFDMKKRIAEVDLENLLEFGSQEVLKEKLNTKWYSDFTSEFCIESENSNYYRYNNEFNKENKIINQKYEKSFDFYIYVTLKKYLNKLGIHNNSNNIDNNDDKKKKQKENKENFTLSILDSYLNSKQEEKIIGQESIPNNDIFTIHNFISSSFYFVKDKKQKYFSCLNRIIPSNKSPYHFLEYFDQTHSKWFKLHNKYSDGELSIFYNQYYDENNEIQIPKYNKNRDIKNLLRKANEAKYSEKEKIKDNNSNIIYEWIFTKNSCFIIGGTVRINYNTMLKFVIGLLFPVLLAYAILLLILLSDFISCFINIPINIYKEAIVNLEKNNYGTTIKSFSKDEFNSITKAFNEMSIALKEKEQIKRFVSDRLVQSVENNEIQEAGDVKQEKITILSSDIRNFTGISEKYEPSEIVEILNSYFTIMQKAISENGGIIDKYIGDAIQAVFYDEPNKENQVIRASKAAVAMRKSLKEFNDERKAKGLFTIENGIGIDTDIAITGTIGTTKGRKDFSVNGDVINKASELEAKTKMTTSKILISKKSLEELCTREGALESTHHSSPSTYHSPLTTNHAEASASANNPLLPPPSSLSPKNMDCHENKTVYNTSLVYREFDNDSVELLDVRK